MQEPSQTLHASAAKGKKVTALVFLETSRIFENDFAFFRENVLACASRLVYISNQRVS